MGLTSETTLHELVDDAQQMRDNADDHTGRDYQLQLYQISEYLATTNDYSEEAASKARTLLHEAAEQVSQ